MVITRVYDQNGNKLREYPDAFASPGSGCQYIWDTSLEDKKDKDGNWIKKKNYAVTTGNWIACITGPAIIIEEHQDGGS